MEIIARSQLEYNMILPGTFCARISGARLPLSSLKIRPSKAIMVVIAESLVISLTYCVEI